MSASAKTGPIAAKNVIAFMAVLFSLAQPLKRNLDGTRPLPAAPVLQTDPLLRSEEALRGLFV